MRDKRVNRLLAWLRSNFLSTQLNVGFVFGLENVIADVMLRWWVKSGHLKESELEMRVDDVSAIIVEKWDKLHEGHASVSTMIHTEKTLTTGTTVQEMRERLKSCQVCQRNSDKRRSSVSTVNFSRVSWDVVGLDFVGPSEGVYLSVKVDYVTRLVQVDTCEKVGTKHMIWGLKKWTSLRGRIGRIKANKGMHFDNYLISKWSRKQGVFCEFVGPHNHGSNGLMEICYKNVLQVLQRCRSHYLQAPWWTQVKIVEGIVNNSFHWGIGMTSREAWNLPASWRHKLLEKTKKIGNPKDEEKSPQTSFDNEGSIVGVFVIKITW